MEPDSVGEGLYVESIGMIELLIEHGKKIGLYHFHRLVYLLIIASRDSNLWW